MEYKEDETRPELTSFCLQRIFSSSSEIFISDRQTRKHSKHLRPLFERLFRS